VFTASDGSTLINHQVERYNPVTGQLVAWVQIPLLSATVNTDFYLYFGNNTVTIDPSTTNTWDSNFQAAYHLNLNQNDVTSNGNNLSLTGTSLQSPAVAADGRDIESTEKMFCSPSAAVQTNGNVTLETWINFETLQPTGNDNVLISCGGAADVGIPDNMFYSFNFNGGGANPNKPRMFWEFGPGTNESIVSTATTAITPGTWYHLAAIRDVTNSVVRFFIDGIQLGADVTYTNAPSGGTLTTLNIGEQQDNTIRDIDADFDEIRISNAVRIPEWMQATYQTGRIGSTFITYSTTTCVPPSISAAGPNQILCISTPTTTLAANTPTTGTGTWSVITGTGIITNSLAANSTVTNLSLGTNVLQWNITSAGTCSSTSSTMTIQVDPAASIATAGPNQTLCISTPTTVLAGNTPTIGVGTWSVVSGTASITNSLSATSAVTGLGVGNNVLQWSITNNGACPQTVSTMTIQVDNLPTTSLAGSSQTLCISNPNYTMTGNIPTFGTGVWSLLLGSGTITAPNSGTTTVTNLGLGQNIFLWTITNGVCFQSASSVILTINPLPSAAAASSNTVVCISSPTTPIFGNTPAVGTGTWSVASGSGTITAPNSPTTTATNLGLGINILQWGVGTVGCAPTTATIAVQIDNVPTPAMAGPNQTLCINNPTTTLAGNSVTVGSGVWSVVFGTANIISILNPSTAVTGLTTGTNVLQWTTTNGVCAPSISTMSIQVDNNTVFASAGPNQTLCAASPSTTLAGNTPTVGIGTWGVLVGSGSVTTPSLSNSTITGLGTGTNILQWVVVNGVCSFNSSIVYLYVIPSPGLPNAGASQTLCVSNPTTTIAANTPSLGTASWSVVSGSANIVTPLTNTSNVLSLPVGDNVLAWTMTHSVCSLTSTLNIHVDNIPSLPIAGPNQTICISSPTTVLAANTPTSGVGTWSLMSGSGTITTPTLATSSVTGLGLGINVLQWTINGGACGTNSSTMSIKVDNIPTTAIAGPNQTLCISNPTTTLGGNIPATGIGTWSVMVGSGIITTSTLGTSGVTGLIVGVNVLEWSIASGGCGSTTSTMSIQVDGIPSISVAGTNQTLCVNSPSTTLNGNVPTVGVGTWSVLSGSGTIASPTLATSNITGLTIGLNILEWSISSGTCGVSSSTMSIQLDAAPTSPTVSVSQTICVVNPTATISGNVPTVGTGSWSLVSGSGTITSPTSATTTLNNLGVGVNVFEWVITNGVCVAPIATVAITVDPATTIANAGANQTICINSSALMTANSAAIGTGSWTVVSGSGTIITPTSANTSITNLGLGINVFAWTISNNCSTSTSTVSITKDQVPSASIAGADQNFCGATTFNLNAVNPVIGSGCWSVLFGGSSVSNPTLNISTLTGLTTGTNALIWTVTNGSCPPSKDTVQIIIDALPTSADAGIDQTTCVTSATLNGNAPTVGVGVWTVAGGSPVITNPLLNNSAITVLSAPTNIFVWCVCNGICPMSSDTVIITVLPPTNSAFAGNDTTIFINQVTLTANNPAQGIGLWTLVSGNANIVNPSSFVTAVNSLKPGLNTLKWTITGLCGITEDDINITLIDTEVPNGISPNGDGKNEYFEIPFIGSYSKVEIKIINRWGNLVYENTNYKNDWNGLNQEGQTLADDTYFYVLNLDNILKTGYITIKR